MTDQELKDLVAGLAVSGERVERNLDRLAEETRLRQEETRLRQEETDQQLKKTAQVVEELGRKVDKVCGKTGGTDEQLGKTDRQMTELEKTMDKLGRKVDKVCGQVGGIGNNNGYYSETFFQDVFEESLEFGGIKYDKMIPNFGRNDDEVKMEIDIVLINGNSLALIEAKYRIHPDFVKEFAEERLKKFRETYPKYNGYKIYLGIAGFSFDQKVLAEAKEYGVGIVKQAGEGIEVEADCLKAY